MPPSVNFLSSLVTPLADTPFVCDLLTGSHHPSYGHAAPYDVGRRISSPFRTPPRWRNRARRDPRRIDRPAPPVVPEVHRRTGCRRRSFLLAVGLFVGPGVHQRHRGRHRRREQHAHGRDRIRQRPELGPDHDRVRLLHGRQQPHLRGPGRHRPDHPRAVPGARPPPSRPTSAHLVEVHPAGRGRSCTTDSRSPSTTWSSPSSESSTRTHRRSPTGSSRPGSRRCERSTHRTSSWCSTSRSRKALPRLTIAKIMPKHVFAQPGAWDDAAKGKAIGSGPYGRPRTTRSRTRPSRRSPTTTGRASPASRR